MKYEDQILVGGRALVALGSSRNTQDSDYLVYDKSSREPFLRDNFKNIDYLNANGNKFFREIYHKEKGKQIASPQSLLELKAYAFVQHCQNLNFMKADEAEFDMKFLCREFDLTEVLTIHKYVSDGELSEIEKVIHSVRR